MPEKHSPERVQRWMTLLGGYLVLLPNGVSWYWGNVSIYVYSYFHHKNQSNSHQDVKAPWLLSMYIISMSLAVMVSGYINNKIGRRLTISLGIALFDGGLIGSYFVFSDSMALMDITMGILCGFGCGLMHAMVLQTIVEWTATHLGFIAAVLFTSYAIGSIMINQIITHYLNPDNKKVDVLIGKTHFFSQEDILDKVPSMFLALSTASGIFHVLGFFLIRVKELKEHESVEERDNDNNNSICRRSSVVSLPQFLQTTDSNLIVQTKTRAYTYYDSMRNPSEWLEKSNKTRSVSFLDSSMNSDIQEDDCEKSPCQVLRTKFFYVIWFMVFGSDSVYMCLSNYYKIFGQIWIKDDHFLTNLGTVYAVFTVVMRMVWGILTDFVGFTPALVTVTSGLALISAGYFFTAALNKWLFFVATILYGCLNCGVYVNFIVAMHTLYGKVNFTKNYGLLASATIILNLAFPSLAKLVLSHLGWFWLFFAIGFINLCSLVLVVFSLPGR